MNPKLLFFLVLLCFPNQPFYLASGAKFSGLGKTLKTLKGAVEGVALLCDVLPLLSRSYNCSSLVSPAVYHTSSDTDSTMPDASLDMFVVNISVGGGASPQNVPLIVDITLDYTFVLCQCNGSCSTEQPVYDPSLSTTFSNYTCSDSECPTTAGITCSNGDCTYNYTDTYVTSEGSLKNDTFDILINSFTFGCGEMNKGNYGSSLGYLGLGNGGLSLLSQGSYGYFSYCIGSTGYSVLSWGSSAELQTPTGNPASLLQNSIVPNFYYVNFTGVSVGGQDVQIPSNAYLPQEDGTGGMILYTTITITGLEESAYNAMKNEFVKQMSSFSQVNASQYGLDLCFDISTAEQLTVPQLTLHFDGGADFSPQSDLYFSAMDPNGTVGCLLVIPLQGLSILGSWMQYDTQMIYDVDKSTLWFQSANCSSLI